MPHYLKDTTFLSIEIAPANNIFSPPTLQWVPAIAGIHKHAHTHTHAPSLPPSSSCTHTHTHTEERAVNQASHVADGASVKYPGTHFTCFTSTTVQILTPQELQKWGTVYDPTLKWGQAQRAPVCP